MIKNNSNKELTVPYIPVMTFDEITAVKDFRNKKDTPKVSVHSSHEGQMPMLSSSPDKNNKAISPNKKHKDDPACSTNHPDIINPVFGAMAGREVA
jgi:hypothetical protein